jgi:MFS family permease
MFINMKENVYVDRLFADYEDTPEIKDFKEEITGNLKERIKELMSEGLDEEKAFEKATVELGDITAIADEIGKRKRNEAIGQMYIKAKVPITKRTAVGLTAASGLFLLAVGLALIALFSVAISSLVYYVSAILLAIASGLYTYFGLTQETTAHYAMKKGRALAYGIVCLTAFLGTGLAVVAFLFNGIVISIALGIKMVFILPAICALIFLLMTEAKRQKPWLKAMIEQETENSMGFRQDMTDPVKAARFGLISGGAFMLSIAVFLTIGFLVSWQYSWLVLPFGFAIQAFMSITIFKKKKKEE